MKRPVKEPSCKTPAVAPAKAGGHPVQNPPESAPTVRANVPAEPVSGLAERRAAPAAEQVCFEWNFPGAKQVFIAGSFNNWQPNATPLQNCGAGRWLLNLALKPGRYEYRFVVDGRWTDDPESEGCGPNPAGGRNSLMIV